MLTSEHRKEDLSRAYVQAVGAVAGVIVNINGRGHDYGVDGSFHEVTLLNGRRAESGVSLDFQLKATTRLEIYDDLVVFDLDSNTINTLAHRANRPCAKSAILIVLSMPLEPNEWLQLSERELVLKNCCYWSYVSSLTNNLYTAKHKIPRKQIFTPVVLSDLLEKVAKRALV